MLCEHGQSKHTIRFKGYLPELQEPIGEDLRPPGFEKSSIPATFFHGHWNLDFGLERLAKHSVSGALPLYTNHQEKRQMHAEIARWRQPETRALACQTEAQGPL